MSRSMNHRCSSRRIHVLAALLVCCVSGPAFGQAVDIPAAMDSDTKAPPTFASFQYGHQFETDVEDGGGTTHERNTAFFGLGHRVALGTDTSLVLLGNYTLHAYDFGGGRAANNRFQWDRVHRGVLATLIGHDVNERWRILGGAMLRTWGETGAQFEDTISGGLLVGFDYHTSEDFSIGLMVGALSQLSGGVGLIPVPTLKWKIDESWRLNVGMVQLVDPGVGAQLDYQITPEVSLGGGFTFQSRQFRLSDANRITPTTGRPNRTDDGGIGQETEIPIFATLRWKPAPKVMLDLNGGVAVAGNLRVEDEDGGRIRDDNYDPAGILAFKAQFFF
jgi:hypothetical protein